MADRDRFRILATLAYSVLLFSKRMGIRITSLSQQRPLSPARIRFRARWVRQLSNWSKVLCLPLLTSLGVCAADRHWAYQPLLRPAIPATYAHVHTSTNPIDAFIRAKLSESKLAPAPEADKRTLLRR